MYLEEIKIESLRVKFNLNIRCKERFTCIDELISEAAHIFIAKSKNKHEETILELISNNSLMQILYEQLDNCVMTFLNKDLDFYKTATGPWTGKVNLLNINDISKDQALNLFNEYLDACSRHFTSLKICLEKNYQSKWKHGEHSSDLKKLLKKITNNFIKNISNLLIRVKKDKPNIIRGFIPPYGEAKKDKSYRLCDIQSTGSDPHKGGQQVMVLVFTDNKRKYFVIYKPTNLNISALLVGDTTRLKEINPNFQGTSFLEIINLGLSKCGTNNLPGRPLYRVSSPSTDTSCCPAFFERKKKKEISLENEDLSLPSYLIYPCYDEEGDYGYIEFLSSYKFPLNLEVLTHQTLLPLSPTERKNIDLQRLYDKYHTEYIENIVNQLKRKNLEYCDFIISLPNDQELINKQENYSYQWGLLAGLAMACGISDLHCENVRISHHKPFLTDVEVAFNFQAMENVAETNLFSGGIGALLADSKSSVKNPCLFDITGICASFITTIQTLQANHLYYIKENGEYGIFPIVKKIFLSGFHQTLRTITLCETEIKEWLSMASIKQALIRHVPFPTTFLYSEIEYFLEGASIKEQLDKQKKSYTARAIDEHQENPMNFPDSGAFLNEAVIKEFLSLSIPHFSLVAEENILLNSYNEQISIEGISPHPVLNYFTESPYNKLYQHLSKIISSVEYRQNLIENIQEKANSYLKVEKLEIEEEDICPVL